MQKPQVNKVVSSLLIQYDIHTLLHEQFTEKQR